MSRCQREYVYGHKYKKILLDGPQTCIYCGLFAEEKDHIPPLYWIRECSEADCVLVWACKECNHTLRNQLLYTIEERCKFLYKKYKRKYAKILKIPNWSNKELSDIDKSFQLYILDGLTKKRATQERLKYLRLSRKKRIESWMYKEWTLTNNLFKI